MAIFTFDQAVKKAGVNPQDVKTLGVQEQPQKEDTFLSGLKTAFKERTERAATEQIRASEGEISKTRGVLRTLGEGAGMVGDVGFEALKLLAPKSVEELTAKGVKAIGKTELAQSLAEKYTQLKQKHPEAVADLESVINIGSLIPIGKATEVVAKGVGKGITKISPFAEEIKSKVGDVADTTKITLFGRAKPTSNIDDVIKQADESIKPAQILTATEKATAKPSLMERWSGISPDIKNRISGKQDKLKEYFDVAHARNNFDTLPTPLEYGARNVDTAYTQMESVLNDTGSQIGQFRQKVGTYKAPIDKVVAVENRFINELNKLNLEIKNGVIKQKAGTVKRVNSDAEIKALNELYGDLKTVKQSPNLGRLIDLRNLFDSKINFAKTTREVSSSLDPLSRNVRRQIADVSAEIVGKSEAGNLAKYSEFIDAFNQLKSYTDRKAGAEFLLKQVLSERGGTPRQVMQTIKDITGVDLMDDAVMASIATDLIGNSRQKGLFRQEITKAGLDTASILKGDTRGAIELMFNFLKKGLINEEKQFLKAAQ